MQELRERPDLQADATTLLDRVDRAKVQIKPVSATAIPHLARLAEASRSTPVLIAFDEDPTQCEQKERQPCSFADVGATRADGRRAAELHLSPPRGDVDQVKALLWALGMTSLLPVAALATRDPDVMRPPQAAPPPREEVEAYRVLSEEQRAAGLYESRTRGSVGSYGRIFRGDERGRPIREVVVDLWLAFTPEGRYCDIELRAPSDAILRGENVSLDRRSVTRIQCLTPSEWRQTRRPVL